MNITVTFPDGNKKDFNKGITVFEVAESISSNFALRSVAAKINDKLVDVNYKINEDVEINLFNFDTEIGKEVFWHSTAHLMAEAVQNLFPDVKVTIGPAIEEGFYYDFDREEAFTDKELLDIEQKIMELAKQKKPYERKEISRNEAIELFNKMEEPYKIEILNEIPEDEVISLYTNGDFTDLCRGPHIRNTGMIKAVKLLKTSGAYWRGNEKNKMLKRIYGISFPSKKELKKYLIALEEKKLRDHRKIGKDLELFAIDDNIGAGLVLWLPNGAMIRSVIEQYWKNKHFEAGYQIVNTPHIGKSDLWETSGHLDFYSESMYAPIIVDEQEYYLKPMNCPFHIAIYKNTKRSYRELPIRYAEMGTVYRYERSGALHGLMRVRGFTQDDAHIICSEEQVEQEVENLITFSFEMLKKFGFDKFDVFLSTKPEKSVGDVKQWEMAESSLKNSLVKRGIDFKIDEGGGAFYGPKIDIKIKDALNRSWQCSTVQFDFNLPSRFEMEYVGADNKPHRPYMIHRALLGSMERFFGTLIEFHGGNFPIWLCPVQVKIIPVSDLYLHYAQKVSQILRKRKIRVEIDTRSEKVGYKIRDAELKKIPYMFIVGQEEEDNDTVALRKHGEGDIGAFDLNYAIDLLLEEIEEI